MRDKPPLRLELGRITDGPFGSTSADGMMGAFVVNANNKSLRVISSGFDKESGWEHVSVSTEYRTPSWKEMCLIKNLFWEDEECVVQYHPSKSEYVNHHPHCLHLWKPIGVIIPIPPSDLVGPK